MKNEDNNSIGSCNDSWVDEIDGLVEMRKGNYEVADPLDVYIQADGNYNWSKIFHICNERETSDALFQKIKDAKHNFTFNERNGKKFIEKLNTEQKMAAALAIDAALLKIENHLVTEQTK